MRSNRSKKCGRPQKYPQIHDPEWLAPKLAQGLTHREIADEVGCSPQRISDCVRELRIESPRSKRSGPSKIRRLRIPATLARTLNLQEEDQ